MKSIAIVTDSNCGISPSQAKDLGIYMLPMPFFIDEKEYLEDIDMNQAEFFQYLEQHPECHVSTSQPTPESVTTLWDSLLKDYDEIVHIPMSSGLSSSMQTARMLAEDYDGHVRVVNNQRISGTLRYSAIEAIQQAKNGLSADEIGTWLEENRFGEKINLDVIHSHNLEAAEEFRKEVLTTFPGIGEVNIFPLSLSVSCHIGPGSLALTCSKVHPEIW